jgi:hypothetical protein
MPRPLSIAAMQLSLSCATASASFMGRLSQRWRVPGASCHSYGSYPSGSSEQQTKRRMSRLWHMPCAHHQQHGIEGGVSPWRKSLTDLRLQSL